MFLYNPDILLSYIQILFRPICEVSKVKACKNNFKKLTRKRAGCESQPEGWTISPPQFRGVYLRKIEDAVHS